MAKPQKEVPPHLVREIRERYALGGISQARLAAELGLSETTVFRIVNKLGAYLAETALKLGEPLPEGKKAELDAMMERLMKVQEEKGVGK